ncbi:MAG TPA: hemolysin family protein [Vicinamibacterales bacterium]|jgi:CBS domain containing-hemolysin-like protein|nr:hemolysin family protein [Vicinamibacterales bacterium]
MPIALIIIAALLLANAMFVAAEFSIVSAPRSAIEARAARSDRLARIVHGIITDPARQVRFIATAQIGITLASLGLGMYGEHVVAGWLLSALGSSTWAQWLAAHGFASVVAVAGLTYFHIVLGEMLPKSLALQTAERLALWLTPLMLWIQTLLYPFVIALNAIGGLLLKPFGITQQAHSADQYYTSEELQLIVEESEEQGALRSESGRVLQELFEFGELNAGEVMVPRVRIVGIPVGAGPDELRRILGTTPHTRYPVYEGDLDHIVGTYHIKDLLRLLLNEQRVTAAGARSTPMVPETALLDAVLATMRRERAQFGVVLDEHGGTSGIVTLEDLFEEVVGEIDEGPVDRSGPRRDPAGRLRVPGTMRLDELGQLFDLELTHEDVDSVSGLILTGLGRPPRVGDSVKYERLRLDVTAVKGRGVDEAAVTLLSPRESEGDAPG